MKPSILRKNRFLLFFTFAIAAIVAVTMLFAGCAPEEVTTGESSADEVSGQAGSEFGGQGLTISGSTTLLPIAESASKVFMDEFGGEITVSGGGSGTGIAECINGTNDIGQASRKIKDKELDMAKDAGIDIVEVVVAYDALSIVISENIEGIDNLTIEQLSGIFRGDITNWSEVGGPDAEIVLAGRDSNSGTYGYFLERVVQLDETQNEYEFTPKALALASNAEVVDTVVSTDNAVGYIGLGYLEEAVSKDTQVVTVEGVEPSIETTMDGSYPIARGLYNYYREGDLNELGHDYLDFVLNEEGQQIVLDVGFVPVPE
ncbi:MAG: PstS family phosphate ABC transporter substrate-binding protein [Actinomycetota bacterium]